MSDEKGRRNFIKKFATAASGALLVSKTGLAMEHEIKEPNIKRVRPLGFQWETMDPFLFCVHHEDAYPKGNKELGPDVSLEGREIGQDFLLKDGWRMYHGDKVPGFPGHPHRGFETITVVRKGMVDHTDSQGASGRYGNGDVQWMTAGKGLLHAEMFPLLDEKNENPMELFQIWLNLPKSNKFVEPHFKMLWSESIPIVNHRDENYRNTKIEIVAGKLEGENAVSPPPNSWAADSANEVGVWNIEMDANAKWKLPKASAGINRTVYYFKGESLKLDGQDIKTYHAAEVRSDVDLELVNGNGKSYILVLQGKPIGEPVVQHGPFVMNSQEEIQQAFRDYQRTQFGGWPWPENGPVHDKNLGRFAIHGDGSKEEKS